MSSQIKPVHVKTRKAAFRIAEVSGGQWFYIEDERETKYISRGVKPTNGNASAPREGAKVEVAQCLVHAS